MRITAHDRRSPLWPRAAIYALSLFFFAAVSPAAETLEARLGGLTAALGENNAERALTYFDPGMPDYAWARRALTEVTSNPHVSSSIHVVSDEETSGLHKLTVDWSLELATLANAPIQQRHERMQIDMRQIDGDWKIVRMSSLRIFAPADRDLFQRIARLASDLSESDADAVLDAFDSQMPGYDVLERNIEALAAQADISCDIDMVTDSETDGVHKLDLDWFLQVKSLADDSLFERRRQRVQIEMRQIRGRWKITSFSPLTILDPLRVR